MLEWLNWFTHLENSKVFALVLFFSVFCLILLYVYSSSRRSKRLESYRFIPLRDEPGESLSEENK